MIQKASDSFDPGWPEEQDLWKFCEASGGFFAYAQAVIKYIGDSNENPASQFSDIMSHIDKLPMTDVPQEDHPMALLDVLYARILSKIPDKTIINTRMLLLALGSNWDQLLLGNSNFLVLCNWLGMTPDEAYAALRYLPSVLRIPRRDEAVKRMLEPFHMSFIDYVTRSGFCSDIAREAKQLKTECVFRVLNEVPDGVDFGDVDYELLYGTLRRGLCPSDEISLTWLADEEVGWDDNDTSLTVYKLAIGEVIAGISRGDTAFQNEFCLCLLATQFEVYDPCFPFYELRDLVFVSSS